MRVRVRGGAGCAPPSDPFSLSQPHQPTHLRTHVSPWPLPHPPHQAGSDKDKSEACVAALDLACLDLAAGAFADGFETARAALALLGEQSDALKGGELGALLCQLWTLRGVEHLLMRRDRVAAVALAKVRGRAWTTHISYISPCVVVGGRAWTTHVCYISPCSPLSPSCAPPPPHPPPHTQP